MTCLMMILEYTCSVLMAIPGRVMDILDPSMPLYEENDEEQIEEGIKEKAVMIDIRH